MRRLRALLGMACCRPRGAGLGAPTGGAVHAGWIGRRGLLGLIAAAPMVLPAAVRAAAVPVPLVAGSTIALDGGSACGASLARYHAELDAYAERVERWGDAACVPAACPVSPIRVAADPEAVLNASTRVRADLIARGVWGSAFVDDVGSGP